MTMWSTNYLSFYTWQLCFTLMRCDPRKQLECFSDSDVYTYHWRNLKLNSRFWFKSLMCDLRFLLSSGINIADPSYHTWEYFGSSNFNKVSKRGKSEKRGCNSLNVCLFTSKFIRWNPKVMVLVGEAFGEQSSHEWDQCSY